MTVGSTGTPQTWDDYYPFGSLMSGRSQTNSSVDGRYKFTTKERDTETGYDYFGARYYDSRIGRWLQVDPLASKYPGWSPYNYTIGNPLKFIDTDGRKIKLVGNKKSIQRLKSIINILKSTKTGFFLYRDLDKRPEIITLHIVENLRSNDGIKLNGKTIVHGNRDPSSEDKPDKIDVSLDPKSANEDSRNKNLKGDQGAAVTTGHEFGHAKSALDNFQEFVKEKKAKTAEEKQAKPYEDAIRKELEEKNQIR